MRSSAWFALSTAALTTIYPIWAPNRVLFGSVGLGISLVALLAAVHPLLPLLLVVARLAAFSLSPGPTLVVLPEAARSGAFMDFAQLTRLQRLMADTRQALVARYPALPRDARVGQHNMPRQAEYAFGGDHAPQVWYRDTTLRWVRFEDYSRDTAIRLVTIAEYQLGHVPVVALVEPAAMRNLVLASGQMAANDLAAALHSLAAAESLQRDPAARVFVATVVAKRAICLLGQGHGDAARGEAGRALARLPESVDARYVLAATGVERGEWAEASAQLDTLLAISPDDGDAKVLRERIRQGRAAGK